MPHINKEKQRIYYRDWYARNGRKRTKHDLEKGYEYTNNHKAEFSAERKVHYALRHGKMVKPSNCQVCGIMAALCGHHHDYTKPLDVIWVCYSCHKLIHNGTIDKDKISNHN